jgi:hypothetical protein
MKRYKKTQVSNYSKKEEELLKALGFSTFLELVNSGNVHKISEFLDIKEDVKPEGNSDEFFLDL